MDSNSLKGKRVIIFQQRGWGLNVGHFLAKKLKGEGCVLATITSKKATHDFTINQTDVSYEKILNHDIILGDPKNFLGDDYYPLSEICQNLGVDSIWPLMWAVRQYTLSFRDKYYYGFKKNVSDEVMVDYIMAVYKCVKMFFEEFKPDIIIAPNFVGLYHIMFNLYGIKHGVPMITVTDSKIQGVYIFSHSYDDSRGSFFKRADELNNNLTIKSPNAERAKKYIEGFREKFKKPVYQKDPPKKNLLKIIRHAGAPYYHSLVWLIKRPKNPWPVVGISSEWRPPRIILRDHYSDDRNRKFMNNFNYYPFEKVKKYVYFPLQYQPEASIDVAAPHFSNQIEVARQIAMSLPDDYTLVVKEHPAMVGHRPSSYIEKVARLVNVKFIDYRIPSEKVLRGADLVISPNSTTLAEAAFYYKPAIQLGNLGTTLKLPNVYKHTDFATLDKKIRELLRVNLKNNEYETKLKNYVTAAYDTGFDMDYLAMWEMGKQDQAEKLWTAYKKEIEYSLNTNF